MSSIKNLHIYQNQENLKVLRDEYKMMGFDTELEDDRLVVFALRRKKEKKKKDEAAEKEPRNKREEKFARQ